jgi:pimeloyl-ACP methyl ester carboxylesterase
VPAQIWLAIITGLLGLLTAGFLALLNAWISARAGVDENLRSQRLELYPSARQVRRYFTEQEVREASRARLAECVSERTRVIVAHSLGSIVAYETLCAHPEWDVDLVTLGSPLGVRNIVFDRLVPRPEGDRARCPVSRWTNIADRGDIVALVKRLGPLFGPNVTDLLVHNGAKAHDARPYLTSREAGTAVAEALV